jgi:phosphonopyruvate decarboxylase
MIDAAAFCDAAERLGFSLWSGVPCSYLKPFINFTIDSPRLRYVGATNEGDAVAIASGAWFAGQRGVAMFQNSGLGNAVNPLTSLNAILKLPVLVICTWRSEPGGAADEPQHALMGPITPALLGDMQIPWELFPTTASEVSAVLCRAVAHMDNTRTPYALIMQKDAVAPYPLHSSPTPHAPSPWQPATAWSPERPTRTAALKVLRAAVGPGAALVATTGFTGRELYALGDLDDQLYMVGSMGCAASLGLGIALSHPDKRVLVVDGDGALLMRLGILATLGVERPANLIHVLLDNEVHDSTGGQSTVSHSVDLGAVAAACGIPTVVRAPTLAALSAAIEAARGLTFIHVKTAPGAPSELPRPKVTPDHVAARLRAHLLAGGAAPHGAR